MTTDPLLHGKSKAEQMFYLLLKKGDDEIRALRAEVQGLKEKISSSESMHGKGESEIVIALMKRLTMVEETNARLMLKIEELNGKLKK